MGWEAVAVGWLVGWEIGRLAVRLGVWFSRQWGRMAEWGWGRMGWLVGWEVGCLG